jgi:hypothetical protein
VPVHVIKSNLYTTDSNQRCYYQGHYGRAFRGRPRARQDWGRDCR